MHYSESKEERKRKALALLQSLSKDSAKPAVPKEAPAAESTDEFREARSKAIERIGLAGSVSSGKVRDHLRGKGFNSDLIEEVMLSLEKDGYLDDYRCGRRVILRHREQKAKSRAMMSMLLKQQGISPKVVDELLKELPEDSENLKQLLDREDYSTQAEKARVLRKMMGRGFERYAILRCMDEVQAP